MELTNTEIKIVVKNMAREMVKRATAKNAGDVPGHTQWNMFAGGTGAAEGKHSYQYNSDYGQYNINPISRNGRHAGYSLKFANTSGKVSGGLWHDLGMYSSPQDAARAAKEHNKKISK